MGWLRSKDPLQVITFQTYGTEKSLYIKGRALEDENIDLSKKNVFQLLINSWKRFETDEIRNAKLVLRLPNGWEHQFMADDEGYFLVKLPLEGRRLKANEEGWVTYEISFVDPDPKRRFNLGNRFPGEMMLPPKTCDFGVVSDIDDTILHTGLISPLKWRVIYNTLFTTPGKRLPLTGAADFYHRLHRGPSGDASNPIFYVSNSPWNLYRYLEFFLRENNFPKGPILLRSLSSFFKRHRKASEENKPHKPTEILNILETYPDMPLILIGDSGEKDADIYMEIAQRFPDRIKAIYLRTVAHNKKMLRVKGLFAGYKTTPVLFVENSKQAIQHAQENGFIK
ncbi:App1 family protein [Arenibacter lacus]|uniref:App1 family protein n=1 Tax=Arenibacter lacus TaxID=2608629 RepID=UPI00123DD4D7|nr:phosphatase domain-containing protein [Arenibacter lacus]